MNIYLLLDGFLVFCVIWFPYYFLIVQEGMWAEDRRCAEVRGSLLKYEYKGIPNDKRAWWRSRYKRGYRKIVISGPAHSSFRIGFFWGVPKILRPLFHIYGQVTLEPKEEGDEVGYGVVETWMHRPGEFEFVGIECVEHNFTITGTDAVQDMKTTRKYKPRFWQRWFGIFS